MDIVAQAVRRADLHAHNVMTANLDNSLIDGLVGRIRPPGVTLIWTPVKLEIEARIGKDMLCIKLTHT